MKNLFQHLRMFAYLVSSRHVSCCAVIFVLVLFFTSAIQAQQPVLKHSYTFDNGTAKDMVGEAHGTLHGGKITNGEYVSYAQGHYIDLPGDKIKINNYKTLSLEAYLVAGHYNAFFTMFSYFGNSVGNFGTDYLFHALSNGGHSSTCISCKNYEQPWAVSTNVFSKTVKDLRYHHMVSTFDNHVIKFYLDGVLVNQNTIDQFPNNVLANLSNQLAYLCKSGYVSDPTWYGSIDCFNIYEGVLDASSVAKSAKQYLSSSKELPAEIKDLLNDVLVNPGFKPECELSAQFMQNFKQSKFVVYPTVIRTPDTTMFSKTSAKAFSELMTSDLKLKAELKPEILDPGKLEGRAQFTFFNNDMKNLAASLKQKTSDADYNVILEILFPPQRGKGLNVFGIHIIILNKEGENAFSFLLNSHHDYFTYNDLFSSGSTEEDWENLKLKSTQVAMDAFKKQLKYAQQESNQ